MRNSLSVGHDLRQGEVVEPARAGDAWRYLFLGAFLAHVAVDSGLPSPKGGGEAGTNTVVRPVFDGRRLHSATGGHAPRELRRVLGIGPVRALAIAEARFERPPGDGPELETLRGIGPKTVAALARELGASAKLGDPRPPEAPARVP